MKRKAQATLEYLVIFVIVAVAAVVVFGLVPKRDAAGKKLGGDVFNVRSALDKSFDDVSKVIAPQHGE